MYSNNLKGWICSDDIGYGWVDTEGMDDINKDDTEIFQDILQFLNRHNLTSVKAILWTVHPGTIRKDATLCKQAKFINAFAENKIWNNVIIICKICSLIVDILTF